LNTVAQQACWMLILPWSRHTCLELFCAQQLEFAEALPFLGLGAQASQALKPRLVKRALRNHSRPTTGRLEDDRTLKNGSNKPGGWRCRQPSTQVRPRHRLQAAFCLVETSRVDVLDDASGEPQLQWHLRRTGVRIRRNRIPSTENARPFVCS
jgi:hypothetical protein